MRATDLNFKTAWQCDETETVDKEVTIYLMTSKTIRTVFVANSAESEDAQSRMGKSQILIGDDQTAFAAVNTVCHSDVQNAGFFSLNPSPCTGSVF